MYRNWFDWHEYKRMRMRRDYIFVFFFLCECVVHTWCQNEWSHSILAGSLLNFHRVRQHVHVVLNLAERFGRREWSTLGITFVANYTNRCQMTNAFLFCRAIFLFDFFLMDVWKDSAGDMWPVFFICWGYLVEQNTQDVYSRIEVHRCI